MNNYLFYLLLLFISFIYASVGHGGASGYLALLSFMDFSSDMMKSYSLTANIFVSAIAFLQLQRKQKIQWRLFFFLIITSFPFAYIGGRMTLSDSFYKLVLGVFLLFSIIRLISKTAIEPVKMKEINIPFALFIGALIGFVSGLLGIGGGIILTPTLLLLNWADMRQAAIISALFIFVNSISGFLGQAVYAKPIFTIDLFIFVAIAAIGGLLGSYFSFKIFSVTVLKKILAIVLVIAVFKLWFS